MITRNYGDGARPTVKDLAWKALRHSIGFGDEGCARKLLPARAEVTLRTIWDLLDELRGSEELMGALDTPLARSWSDEPNLSRPERLLGHLNMEGVGRGRAILLYITTRLARPEIVIETGCFTGWDSALLLQALHRNGRGHLYTIDLPAQKGQFSQIGPRAGLPEGVPTGFLVPDCFKDRWTLIFGNVRQELPSLLDELGDVDLFYHDSDHSYCHIMWEFTTVWPHLTAEGLLVSDDISWTPAFWDFARAVGRRPVIHRRTPNVGALAK